MDKQDFIWAVKQTLFEQLEEKSPLLEISEYEYKKYIIENLNDVNAIKIGKIMLFENASNWKRLQSASIPNTLYSYIRRFKPGELYEKVKPKSKTNIVKKVVQNFKNDLEILKNSFKNTKHENVVNKKLKDTEHKLTKLEKGLLDLAKIPVKIPKEEKHKQIQPKINEVKKTVQFLKSDLDALKNSFKSAPYGNIVNKKLKGTEHKLSTLEKNLIKFADYSKKKLSHKSSISSPTGSRVAKAVSTPSHKSSTGSQVAKTVSTPSHKSSTGSQVAKTEKIKIHTPQNKSYYQALKDYISNPKNQKSLLTYGGLALLGVAGLTLITNYIYKKYFSAAAKACKGKSGAEKRACMLAYERKAIDKTIKKLQQNLKNCDKVDNPEKCQIRIRKQILKWKYKKAKILAKI